MTSCALATAALSVSHEISKLLANYLKTRVARRMYLLFLVVAFTPVVLLGAYAYIQVTAFLINTSQERLREESKAIGMEILGRLDVLTDELRAQALLFERHGLTAQPMHGGFAEIRLTETTRLMLTSRQYAHLLQRGVVLLPRAREERRLLLRLPDRTEVFEGVLLPDALWPDTFRGRLFCLLDTGQSIYCSPEAAALESELPMTLDQHSGTFSLLVGGEPVLAGHWRIPLETHYAHDDITVLSLVPRRDALAVVAHFQRVFPAVLGLALVMAIWLAMSQIRRQMQPLEALMDASARVGRGDFDTRVNSTHQNEFTDLSRVFNRMAASLRRKFGLLETLATLDRAVLSNADKPYIIQTAISSLPSAASCEDVGLLVPRRSSDGESGRLHYRLSSHGPEIMNTVVSFDAKTLSVLESKQPWLPCPQDLLDAEFVKPFVSCGLRSVWLLPVVVKGKSMATLMLCFQSTPEHLDDALQAGRSIADRLASAESNWLWEETLYRKVHFDALTGLPNRFLLRDRVEQAVAGAERDGRSFAFLLLDLNRFREINDSLGHATGDAILIEIGARLVSLTRQIDTVARLGGDEFVILLTDLDRGYEYSVVSRIAENLLAEVAKPISLEERELDVGATIGISIYPVASGRFEDLLKGAEAAMYEAKRLHSGSYRFHSIDIEQRARQRFERIQKLQRGLEREEFLLYFQPKVDTSSGRIVGAEALVRWRPLGEDIIPPGLFLPLVDEIGMTTDLGAWVLHTACRQLAEWDRLGFQLPTISVNVSHIQFLEGDLLSTVRSALGASGLTPDRLELEILEETAFDVSGTAGAKLDELRALGVGIALDDFGTGYSSLSYLVEIPAQVIKLDRAFVRRLAIDERQAGIVGTIITLVKGLDMQVVAEGVEDAEQSAVLARMGCDMIQGFLFSPPIPPDKFVTLLTPDQVHACNHSS